MFGGRSRTTPSAHAEKNTLHGLACVDGCHRGTSLGTGPRGRTIKEDFGNYYRGRSYLSGSEGSVVKVSYVGAWDGGTTQPRLHRRSATASSPHYHTPSIPTTALAPCPTRSSHSVSTPPLPPAAALPRSGPHPSNYALQLFWVEQLRPRLRPAI